MAGTYIQFVDDSPETALADAISDYQSISGRTLGNADPEMLLINAFALRMAKIRTQINYVGNQNLISNATGAALDELGAKFGVYRLDPSAAADTIIFNTVSGAPTLVVPAGTQIKSQDGLVLFATNTDLSIPSGTGSASVDATCTTTGVIGNGYLAGMINIIVDPLPFVTSASNTSTSTGGSDAETDDQLRERIPLASSTFSVAGPEDAYIYWAKTASPSIIDVSVTTPVPGTVNIYPLLAGGVVPDTAILDLVESVCSDRKVRPMCDTVVAVAPTAVNYAINAAFTVLSGYNSTTVATQALTNLNAFVNVWTDGWGALGWDIIVDQLKGQCMSVPGMYSVDFGALADTILDDTQFSNCTSVTGSVVAIISEPH